MPVLPDWLVQVLQVVTVVAVAPLISGVIARWEAIVQQRKGPRILQPYYDIAKLMSKETVLPAPAGPLFRVAPYISFAGYATVPLLIPVLTDYGLPLGYMGDILAGGMILGMAGFAISLAAVDSGSPYAQLGSSRTRVFGALNEPTVIFVIFVVALTSKTDLPYVMAATVRSSTVQVVLPSHLLIVAAFFMLLLNETGRIPIGSHGGTLEFGQLEAGRIVEHSGPGLGFLHWGSAVKQLVLYTIFINVLTAPWGLAASGNLGSVLIAIGLLIGKALAIGAAVVVIEVSFAKLRLYKIPEFTVASFMLAVLGVVIFLFQPGFGNIHFSVFGAAATFGTVIVLMLELGMLRSQDAREQLGLYSLSSFVVAALAIAAAIDLGDNGSLFALGAATIALKGLIFPLGIRFVLRRMDANPRVPSTIGVPSSILIAIGACAFAFIVMRSIHIGAISGLPLTALPVAIGGVLIAFLLMVLRPYAPSQLLGFLNLENAVTVATLVIAPLLPIVLALLLLFDVLVGVLVFVLLVEYLAIERDVISTENLDRLTG